jgi:nicotinate-nucleotide adenylyltransferase
MLMAPRAAPQARAARPTPDEAPRRIGVLGGTFDPPHVGHLWLAALAADGLDLDRVLFMPAAQPPHKGERLISKATDRLLMTRLAIHADPMFELSALEMERPGPSYTIDSVTELKRLYPDAGLFLVMAADSLVQIDGWREPDRLLDEIEWAVGPRAGTELPDRSALEDRFGDRAWRIHLLEGPSLDVSSSAIRRRVAAGHTIRYLVAREVEELIIARELYRRG